jgi:hypothetical protein
MIQLPTIKFVSGIKQKEDPEISEGFQEMEDVSIDKIGSISSVKENQSFLSLSNPVHSIALEGPTSLGYDVILGGSGTSLVNIGSTSSPDGTVIQTGFSGNNMEFSGHSSRAYFTDQNYLYYYSGTTPVYRAGSPVPSSLSTAAGAAGSLSGTYNIKVTFTTSTGYDGNPSGATSQAVTTQKINLSNIPINTDSNYTVSGRKIWIQGGTTPFYPIYVLAKTISDNTSTTAITSLSTNNTLPSQGAKYLTNHYGVLFLSGFDSRPNNLDFSKANGPEQFPPENSFIISRTGDPIMGHVSWDGILVICTRKKIYQMIGSPGQGQLSTNFYNKESRSQYGTIAPRSIVATPYGVFFAAEDGIRQFDGNQSTLFSYDIQDLYNSRNKSDQYESLITGTFFNDQLIYSIPGEGQTNPSFSIVYDFKRGEWTSHANGYTAFVVDRKNGVLFCGTSSGVEQFRNSDTYASWRLTKDGITTKVDSPSIWDKFQVDMEGSCSAEVYLDGALGNTYSLSAPTRQLVTNRFPPGLAHRVKITLTGSAKSTQDHVYSIGISAEPQRGQV